MGLQVEDLLDLDQEDNSNSHRPINMVRPIKAAAEEALVVVDPHQHTVHHLVHQIRTYRHHPVQMVNQVITITSFLLSVMFRKTIYN